ncbi:MAG: hypothetical protein E7591_02860 [Ruminococcaceae bacterium]|nr:hypothetical protein [Oscillospiraceae bacterium]
MKRFLVLILASLVLLSFVSCGKKSSREAFDISKKAFENVNEAYELVNEYSEDIYQAWFMGINESDDIYYDDELINLASELHISQDDLEKSIITLLDKSYYSDGDYGFGNCYGDWYDLHSEHYSDSFFSACVDVVSEAYKINGTVKKINGLLEDAKDHMKTLSDEYSDYEFYPALKEYFTTTSSFFGFCQDPEGSFEQVVETFNDYRNEARDHYYDLSYVFEDGKKKEDEPEAE